MAKTINLDKIYAELSKEQDSNKLFEAFEKIQDFVKKALTQKQMEKETESEELQKKIQSLNGN